MPNEEEFTLSRDDIYFAAIELAIAPYCKNAVSARKKFKKLLALYPDKGQMFTLTARDEPTQREEIA